MGFVDHSDGGIGEPAAGLLRAGRAGQIPAHLREPDEHGRVAVLVRTDDAGATHAFTEHIDTLGMAFSVGASLGHFDIHTILAQIPNHAWTPVYNADAQPRDGAWVGRGHRPGRPDLLAGGHRLVLRKEEAIASEDHILTVGKDRG